MTTILDINFNKGKFKNEVSGIIPTNSNVVVKVTEKGRSAYFSSTSELNGYGILSGAKTVAMVIKPTDNSKLLLDNGSDKLEITGGNYSGTGLTECTVNNIDTDAASLNQWQLVIAEFSGGIDFSTDFEIDVTADVYISYCLLSDSILTTLQKETLYQKFLNDILH